MIGGLIWPHLQTSDQSSATEGGEILNLTTLGDGKRELITYKRCRALKLSHVTFNQETTDIWMWKLNLKEIVSLSLSKCVFLFFISLIWNWMIFAVATLN